MKGSEQHGQNRPEKPSHMGKRGHKITASVTNMATASDHLRRMQLEEESRMLSVPVVIVQHNLVQATTPCLI